MIQDIVAGINPQDLIDCTKMLAATRDPIAKMIHTLLQYNNEDDVFQLKIAEFLPALHEHRNKYAGNCLVKMLLKFTEQLYLDIQLNSPSPFLKFVQDNHLMIQEIIKVAPAQSTQYEDPFAVQAKIFKDLQTQREELKEQNNELQQRLEQLTQENESDAMKVEELKTESNKAPSRKRKFDAGSDDALNPAKRAKPDNEEEQTTIQLGTR